MFMVKIEMYLLIKMNLVCVVGVKDEIGLVLPLHTPFLVLEGFK
jgi:hypothetical protein